MSKISVIVPVYNTGKYLERCISSILNQTLRDLEIILIDDGSTDESAFLCDRYAEKDERIKVIHKNNGGLSSARNAGLEVASAEYVGFVDSDDYVAKDMYEILYNTACQYSADIARVNYKEVTVSNYENKDRVEKIKVFSGNAVEEKFHDFRIESVCVGIYRKETIGSIRFPIGKTSEDIPFNFAFFKKAKLFCYIPIEKYFYFQNPLSISNGKMGQHQLNYIQYREEIYNSYDENNEMKKKAETLCARAYMAVLLRMALYGTEKGIDAKLYEKLYQKKLRKLLFLLLKSKYIPISRKMAAILLSFNFSFTKILLKGFLHDKITC